MRDYACKNGLLNLCQFAYKKLFHKKGGYVYTKCFPKWHHYAYKTVFQDGAIIRLKMVVSPQGFHNIPFCCNFKL